MEDIRKNCPVTYNNQKFWFKNPLEKTLNNFLIEKIVKFFFIKKKINFLKKTNFIFFLVLLINASVVGNIHNYYNNITKFVKFTVGKYKKLDSNNIAFVHFLYLSIIIFDYCRYIICFWICQKLRNKFHKFCYIITLWIYQ